MNLQDRYRSLTSRLPGLRFPEWSSQFAVTARDPWIDGSFSLHRDGGAWDLYGLVDMLICAVTLDPSQSTPGAMDAQRWADRILSCLDGNGLATRNNPTDHVPEHATAYAYTGLVLLRTRGARIAPPPFRYFSAPTCPREEFEKWFGRMGLQFPRWFRGRGLLGSLRASAKRLGWYGFWAGSHVGGGVIATLIMREQLLAADGRVPRVDDVPELRTFFDLADRRIEAATGLWRPWTKRLCSKRPALGDIGGAAHFLWLYDRLGVRHPHPEPLLRHALALQRADGLFMSRPGCIDLDCTHLLSYAARLGARVDLHTVDEAMLRNGIAVLDRLLDREGLCEYVDSHGLPGALCALAQVDAYLRWRGLEAGPSPTGNVLSEACWI